jgi:hypothetical protein
VFMAGLLAGSMTAIPVLRLGGELVELDGTGTDEGEDEVFPHRVDHDQDYHPTDREGDELVVVVHGLRGNGVATWQGAHRTESDEPLAAVAWWSGGFKTARLAGRAASPG